jgi:hypothetical protein
MKPWTEDNYLERLMPQLRQAKRVSMESCPDSELLAAYSEDRVTPFVRAAITAHLAKCADCSEICSRLENFARATVPEQDSEWTNVEKRLGNWEDSFLRSRAAANAPKAEAEPVRVLGWKEKQKPSVSWWAYARVAGAMAIVLVIVGGALLTKPWVRTSSQPPQIAVLQTPPPVTSAPVASAPAESTPASVASGNPPPNLNATASTPKPYAASRNGQAGKSVVHPRGQVNSAPPEVVAANDAIQKVEGSFGGSNTGNATTPEDQQQASAAPAPPVNPSAAAPASSGAAVGANSASPGAHTYAELKASDHIVPASVSSARSSLAKSAAVPKAASIPASELPASVRLEAGSRLWIHVNSINRQPDGSFTFQGSLIQPAANTGVKPLAPGTELTGSGIVKSGKVTVLVNSFILPGATYLLPAPSGALSEQIPGAGKALQFQNGDVLEMWVSLATTYARAAGESKP